MFAVSVEETGERHCGASVTPVIRLVQVGHWFSGTSVLFQDVSAALTAGSLTAICGPSGCGKSTMLGLIAGWEQPCRGRIIRHGVTSTAWVFQNPHGVARRTALDHVVFPPLARGLDRRQASGAAELLMRRFDVAHLASRPFASLSGGEAQRLLPARALAGRPDVLLVDEPTAQLDRHNAATVNRSLGQAASFGTIVVLALLGLAGTASLREIEAQAQVFRASGADVRNLAADGQVDGAACDRLAGVSTVRAAGALRAVAPVVISQAPDVPMTAYEVTVGLGSILGVAPTATPGVWLEQGLADALMVRSGSMLATSDGLTPVDAVFTWPNDGRDARFGFAVLVPVATDRSFDECWMEAWPIVDGNDQLLRSVITVSEAQVPAPIGQLNKNAGTTLDTNRLYHQRVTRHAAWVGPVAFLVMGFLASWRRRLEYAAALHAGEDRGALLLGVALETLVWAATGGLVALVVDAVGMRLLRLEGRWPVSRILADVVWWSLTGAIVGAVAAACLIREKDLFRFFRTR